jgi:hypothetical protein
VTRCSLVAGAVATGAPLSDAERAHVEGCPDCAALVALPSVVARSARAAEPGPGFSARMQIGARARITTRRRRRTAFVAIGAAAAAIMIFLGVQRIRRDERQALATGPAAATQPATPEESTRVRAYLEQMRFDRAMAPAAPWTEIEAPLRSYRAVLIRHTAVSGGPQ